MLMRNDPANITNTVNLNTFHRQYVCQRLKCKFRIVEHNHSFSTNSNDTRPYEDMYDCHGHAIGVGVSAEQQSSSGTPLSIRAPFVVFSN